MLMNYQIGRLVLSSLCVGSLVQLVLGGVRFASCCQFVVCWIFGAAGFRWCSFCILFSVHCVLDLWCSWF